MSSANPLEKADLPGEMHLDGPPAAPQHGRWSPSPRHPRICAGQVHLWRGRLDVSSDRLAAYRRSLSADEIVRAGRFVRDEDRDRWVAGRGFLRSVLGQYLAVAPVAVRFRYGRYGKPALVGPGSLPGFNLSHSGEWVLCAVAPARWVGVDIERVRTDLSVEEMAGVLSPAERHEIASLKEERRAHAFFEKWTRKEAIAKALGAGVSMPFDRLDVGLGSTGPLGAWWLSRITPGEGFEAAVAVDGTGWGVRCWDGPPTSGDVDVRRLVIVPPRRVNRTTD